MPLTIGTRTPKTQKAIGLTLLGHLANNGLSPIELIYLAQKDDDFLPGGPVGVRLQNAIDYGITLMARPCPVRPRHGFVESRVVTTLDEARKVWEETRAADPEGELILCRYIDAPMSGIWTPSAITTGAANDGATAGKNVAVLPLVRPVSFENILSPYLAKAAKIDLKVEDPFIEYVWTGKGTPHPTPAQLRAGPIIESSLPDWIPAQMVVQTILIPNGEDLLQWETRTKDVDPATTVCWHPGGSQTDHYAIHCRTRGIAVITTAKPVVGSTIEPTNQPPFDPIAVRHGIALGATFPIGQTAAETSTISNDDIVCLILTALYHSHAMRSDHSVWIGVAASLMARLGAIAARGEARHLHNKGSSRDMLYRKHYDTKLTVHRMAIRRLVNIFRYGSFNGSIGGHKWAVCAAALVPLYNTIHDIVSDPTVENVNRLIAALNRAVDQAHHNGWWLNKFTHGYSKEAFGAIQATAILMSNVLIYLARAGRAAFRIRLYAQAADPVVLNRVCDRIAGWKPITLEPPTLTGADLANPSTFVSSNILEIIPRTRLLRNKTKKLAVPLGKVVEVLLNNSSLEFFVTPSATGLVINMRQADGTVSEIWKETPLNTAEPIPVGA